MPAVGTEQGKPRRMRESGWELGATGLGKVSWAILGAFLAALGVVLLLSGYSGYGAIILVLAAAAFVNVA